MDNNKQLDEIIHKSGVIKYDAFITFKTPDKAEKYIAQQNEDITLHKDTESEFQECVTFYVNEEVIKTFDYYLLNRLYNILLEIQKEFESKKVIITNDMNDVFKLISSQQNFYNAKAVLNIMED